MIRWFDKFFLLCWEVIVCILRFFFIRLWFFVDGECILNIFVLIGFFYIVISFELFKFEKLKGRFWCLIILFLLNYVVGYFVLVILVCVLYKSRVLEYSVIDYIIFYVCIYIFFGCN